MNRIKNIFKVLFVAVVFCTNINAQQTFQKSSLMNKEWFLRWQGTTWYCTMLFSENEMISTCYYGNNRSLNNISFTTKCKYYLSDNIDTAFDFSKVGQSTSGKYIVMWNDVTVDVNAEDYEPGDENDRLTVYQILFLNADTFRLTCLEKRIGGCDNTWHTADWVDPYADYDNPYADGD